MADTKSSSEGCPAGQPTHAEGQQPAGVLVETARDQRVLDWLIEQVGPDAVTVAANSLAGHRRPYVSNVAKALGLTPPSDLVLSPPRLVQSYLTKCKSILRGEH